MTIEDFESKLTQEQRDQMYNLQKSSGIRWDDFLARAMAPTRICDYVAIPNFHGMYVGIEKDGYAHT